MKALNKALSAADPQQASAILSHILEKKGLSDADRNKFGIMKCRILFGYLNLHLDLEHTEIASLLLRTCYKKQDRIILWRPVCPTTWQKQRESWILRCRAIWTFSGQKLTFKQDSRASHKPNKRKKKRNLRTPNGTLWPDKSTTLRWNTTSAWLNSRTLPI